MMINIYTPIGRLSKYIKQKLAELKGDIGSSTITAGNFNLPPSIVVRTNRQNISKETEDSNRALYSTTIKYTFFVRACDVLQDRSYVRLQIKPQ